MSIEHAPYIEPSLAPHIGSPVVQGVEISPAGDYDSDAVFDETLRKVKESWMNFWLVLTLYWCAVFMVIALSR